MDTDLLKAIESIMKKSLQPIHLEIKQINNRLGNHEDSLKQMNSRMDTFEGSFKQMHIRMDEFEGSLKKMHIRMDSFEETQSEMLTRLSNVETELKDFRAETKTTLRIIQDGQRGTRQEMTQRFNEVKRSQNHLESDVALIYQKISEQDLEVNRIKKQ